MKTILLLLLLATPAFATPITYTINFTATQGIAPTGEFTYDAEGSQFSNFLISWGDGQFDLTSYANHGPGCAHHCQPFPYNGVPCTANGGLPWNSTASMALLNGECGDLKWFGRVISAPFQNSLPTSLLFLNSTTSQEDISIEGHLDGAALQAGSLALGTFSIAPVQSERLSQPAEVSELASIWLMLSGVVLLALSGLLSKA